jgi:hypothetical protein
MFTSRYMPCPECGDSIDRAGGEPHVCNEERLVEFRLFQLRGEVADFDRQLADYLDSPAGRFAAWDAARRRRA